MVKTVIAQGAVGTNSISVLVNFSSDNSSYKLEGYVSSDVNLATMKGLKFSPSTTEEKKYAIIEKTGSMDADEKTYSLLLVHDNILSRLETAYTNNEEVTITEIDKLNTSQQISISGIVRQPVFQQAIGEEGNMYQIAISGKVSHAKPTVNLK